MCSQPSMSSRRTSLPRSRGRMELWFCIHSVWVFTRDTCVEMCVKSVSQKGATCLFALQAIYMFYALAIVCDDYFVPSLEKISEVGELPDHSICIWWNFGPMLCLLFAVDLSEPAAERRCCRGNIYGRGKLCSRAFYFTHWLVAEPIRK